MNDLLTHTLLLIQKSKEGEWVAHFHTVAFKKEPRGWMTYSLPHCCLYKRAKRLNDLFTLTLLPIQKSQEGEQFTHSHTFVYTKEARCVMTYSIPQCSIYKRRWITYSLQYCCRCQRAKRVMTYSLQYCCQYKPVRGVNNLLNPTLLPIQKRKEGE